jgi:hypothetical protein
LDSESDLFSQSAHRFFQSSESSMRRPYDIGEDDVQYFEAVREPTAGNSEPVAAPM